MKKHYPVYNSNKAVPESKQVFDSLSKKNKTAIKSFLSVASVNAKSEKRLDNMNRALIRFFDFLEKDFDKITYNDFIEVSKAISNSKLGVHTRNGDRNFIKRFIQENFDDWRVKFKDLKLMKIESKTEEHRITPKDLITELELHKLIQSTTDMKYKALVSLLYESACRPEELTKLRWNDFDLNNKLVSLYSGKTTRKRTVPINDCVVHLRRLKNETQPNEDDLVFNSNMKGKDKLTNAGLNYILKKITENAGIKKKTNSYTFRHTRLSQLITKLSPKVYEDIAGHSLSMGMKTYAHLSQDVHIQEMNDKVFNVEELTQDEKNKLVELEKKLGDFINLEKLKIQLAIAIAKTNSKKLSEKDDTIHKIKIQQKEIEDRLGLSIDVDSMIKNIL